MASSFPLNMFADLTSLSLLSVRCLANSPVENRRYQVLFNRNLKLNRSARWVLYLFSIYRHTSLSFSSSLGSLLPFWGFAKLAVRLCSRPAQPLKHVIWQGPSGVRAEEVSQRQQGLRRPNSWVILITRHSLPHSSWWALPEPPYVSVLNTNISTCPQQVFGCPCLMWLTLPDNC